MENTTFFGYEKADGDVPADHATSIIKVACIFIIGISILSGVVSTSNIAECSPFHTLFNSVIGNINSGYTLAALMLISLGAGGILYYLGFM
jgi:hypothetical protein